MSEQLPPMGDTAGRLRNVGDRETGVVTAYLSTAGDGLPRIVVGISVRGTAQGGSFSLDDTQTFIHILNALVAAGRAAAQA